MTKEREREHDIPIGEELRAFKEYLDKNSKSIFSARFGDGKTYFLNAFMKKFEKEYIFIPIYPVNYQVADNKDIFEYIKRDIFVKMLSHPDITVLDKTIQKSISLYSFAKENKGDLFAEIMTILPSLNIGPVSFDLSKMVDSVRNISGMYKKYQTKNLSDADKLKSYINSVNTAKGNIYEFDFYSELIRNINTATQRTTGKQIVLVIEDLDRIDPAHIFRILNIFSAHFDNPNYDKGELSELENKFAFDKIITVCHFQNIEKIYAHFYGPETDFEGYIHKFSTAKPFEYSLRERVYQYVELMLKKKLSIPESLGDEISFYIVNKVFYSDKFNLRLLVESFDKTPITKNTSFFTINVISTHSIVYPNSPFYHFLFWLNLLNINPNNLLKSLNEKSVAEYIKYINISFTAFLEDSDTRDATVLMTIQEYDKGIKWNFRNSVELAWEYTDDHKNQLNISIDKLLSIKNQSILKELIELIPQLTHYYHKYILNFTPVESKTKTE